MAILVTLLFSDSLPGMQNFTEPPATVCAHRISHQLALWLLRNLSNMFRNFLLSYMDLNPGETVLHKLQTPFRSHHTSGHHTSRRRDPILVAILQTYSLRVLRPVLESLELLWGQSGAWSPRFREGGAYIILYSRGPQHEQRVYQRQT